MRKFIDGDTLYADVIMMRQVDPRAVVIVEGQEDVSIIDPHLNSSQFRSEIAHSKTAVLRSAELCKKNGLSEAFFAVDRDFDSRESIAKISEYISVTEFYDIQTDIFVKCSDSISRVLVSHVDRSKFSSHIAQLKIGATDLVVQIAGHVGALRYASISKSLDLHMSKFPAVTLIHAYETGSLISEILSIAVKRSKHSTATPDKLASYLDAALSENVDLLTFCNGHDIANILGVLIRGRWGGSSGNGADAVERAIRSSVDWESFQELNICADFRSWGSKIDRTAWRRDLVA
ncbi:hypothetical protein IUQ79_18275 [Mycobacteroides abscessus subsp. bolletii]|uniref:hypothetical protein n=1 Tax=Mycobacteroides abscessus TaxID=36809 RepID=UPI0019D2657C|nr:hypothetical protein [Mycobacteroides abscessus]MBN7303845.1 hypothetical protein [Mycobacteroides abscessus subsp. bolletii]